MSYPATGCQKLFEFDDEKKTRIFNEKRMGQEVEADTLGDEWKGYVLRITGGNDKQGFPMKQGVLTNSECRAAFCKPWTLCITSCVSLLSLPSLVSFSYFSGCSF